MKTVQIIALIFCLLIPYGSIFAQEGHIQQFEDGLVDWSAMTITVTGIGEFDRELSPARHRLSAVRNAREDAEIKLLRILTELNFSSDKTVKDIMLKSTEAANRIEKYFEDYKFIGRPRLMPDSTVELAVELSITGNILNELYIQALDSDSNTLDAAVTNYMNPSSKGLIIDCLGLKCKYALAPRIFSSGGDEVYGLNKINYIKAKERGLICYLGNDDPIPAWMGDNCNMIKAIEISGANYCDAVIDENQAAQIKMLDENREILQSCRVAFLVD